MYCPQAACSEVQICEDGANVRGLEQPPELARLSKSRWSEETKDPNSSEGSRVFAALAFAPHVKRGPGLRSTMGLGGRACLWDPGVLGCKVRSPGRYGVHPPRAWADKSGPRLGG